MQVLIGRVTADATVNTLKDERKVVNFSIAINNSYKPKGRETVKLTTYVNCSYWLSASIAPYLRKGTLVELVGRLGVNAYTNGNGEVKASITLHVNNIQLHGGTKGEPTQPETPETGRNKPQAIVRKLSTPDITEPIEDLPF